MTTPLDLTQRFGEAWCVTLARLPTDEALRRMGVRAPVHLPDGLAQATERLMTRRDASESLVLLLAREAAPGWTVVVQLEGAAGWIGLEADALRRLSAAGGTACSMMSDPNQVVLLFAEDGQVRAGLDAVTGRREGSPDERLAAAFAAVGFPECDDGAANEIANRHPAQSAALVLQATTGVALRDDLFTDPWTGGRARPAP